MSLMVFTLSLLPNSTRATKAIPHDSIQVGDYWQNIVNPANIVIIREANPIFVEMWHTTRLSMTPSVFLHNMSPLSGTSSPILENSYWKSTAGKKARVTNLTETIIYLLRLDSVGTIDRDSFLQNYQFYKKG